MSRSGYSDDIDNWALIKWRGQVESAIRGKRGQIFLRDLLAALDAMPEKRLIANELVEDGEFCALGVLGAARGVDLAKIDPNDPHGVGAEFDIAHQLAQEVVYQNDEAVDDYDWIEVETCGPMRDYYPDYGRHRHLVRNPNNAVAEKRWQYMRAWVAAQIKTEAAT